MKLDETIWDRLRVYLLYDKKLSQKKSSMQSVICRFRNLCRYFKDREFNRENFTQFLAHLKDRGLSNSTINKHIPIAKHIDKLYGLNRLQDYSYFKEPRQAPRDVLTPDEIQRLAEVKIEYKRFKTEINYRQKTLILLLGTTGCRIGEALELTWNDLHSDPPYMILRDTKNGDNRTVPISKNIYNMLQQLPRVNDIVFHSARRGVLNYQQINADLKVRARMCGINKKISCHLFRHSYITTMLESGVDWLDLSVIVGHRDPKTTLRYKHSLLGHYVELIHTHPLLRHEMSFTDISARLRQYVKKTVDTSKFQLRIDESENRLMVEVVKS